MSWLTVIIGYLAGSIPTAYIAGEMIMGKDIRRMGDGNVGARNAYHELGHTVGVLVFFMDAAKGALVVALARATSIGILFALIPASMFILTLPTLAVLIIKKDVILTSVVLFISLPIVSWWLGAPLALIGYGIALSCLVAFTHYLRRRQMAFNDRSGSA